MRRDIDENGTFDGQPRRQMEDAAKSIDASPARFQHYFASSKGAYRYLGAQSPILTIDMDVARLPVTNQSRVSGLFQSREESSTINSDQHRYMLQLFFNSVHKVYPVLDASLPWLSAEMAPDLVYTPPQHFIRQIVYGIACHCDNTHGSLLTRLAGTAHSRALQYIEKATAEQTILTLQVAILLVIYTLFDPTSGNISQQLGFTIRLAMELAGSDDDEQLQILPRLQKIVYSLENHVCSVLVRPTSMPEPTSPLILSTEDPLEFLCTLYRIQARIRNDTLDDALRQSILTVSDSSLATLHPNIVSTLWETWLLLEPSATAAVRLISAYLDDGYIADCFSIPWIHRAGTVVIDEVQSAAGPLRLELVLAHGQAMALLTKWGAKWDGARIVLSSLQYPGIPGTAGR